MIGMFHVSFAEKSSERGATPEVIISIAGVFGIDLSILVNGTDAESRFTESGEWVPKHVFMAVAQKLGNTRRS